MISVVVVSDGGMGGGLPNCSFSESGICRFDSANTARTARTRGFTRKEYAEYREKLTLYDDLLAPPDHVVGEIIDGQLHVQPRPAGKHTLAHSELIVDLGGPFDRGRGGPGGWWILTEPEIISSATPRWRCPTWPAGTGADASPAGDHRFEVVPDWVCEILSPAPPAGSGIEAASLCPLRRGACLAGGPSSAHSGNVRAARGTVESGQGCSRMRIRCRAAVRRRSIWVGCAMGLTPLGQYSMLFTIICVFHIIN